MSDDLAGRIMAHAFDDELEKIAGRVPTRFLTGKVKPKKGGVLEGLVAGASKSKDAGRERALALKGYKPKPTANELRAAEKIPEKTHRNVKASMKSGLYKKAPTSDLRLIRDASQGKVDYRSALHKGRMQSLKKKRTPSHGQFGSFHGTSSRPKRRDVSKTVALNKRRAAVQGVQYKPGKRTYQEEVVRRGKGKLALPLKGQTGVASVPRIGTPTPSAFQKQSSVKSKAKAALLGLSLLAGGGAKAASPAVQTAKASVQAAKSTVKDAKLQGRIVKLKRKADKKAGLPDFKDIKATSTVAPHFGETGSKAPKEWARSFRRQLQPASKPKGGAHGPMQDMNKDPNVTIDMKSGMLRKVKR